MDHALIWAIGGLVLVIAELLTGTFYLLMLGVAAFGAALGAYFGLPFSAQVVVAAAVSVAGCYGVHLHRSRAANNSMPSIDAGMPATFEQWIDPASRLARVRYRGASWEARIDEGTVPEPGSLVYVVNVDGNTLQVAAKRPG
jgi:membrane protein implicated in regulation of membrane protease activity